MSGFAKKVAPIIIGAMLLSMVFAAQAAQAVPRAGKVTICHRTNSETNPYRRITVSANAADGVGSNDHTSHGESYTDPSSVVHPVFDPSVSYPPSDKDWGDIIPPVRGGAGLNWVAGQSIYLGIGDAFGLCGSLSAKQYYDAQVDAGLDPEAVLDDLDDQGSLADKELLDSLGPGSKFSDLDPLNFPSAFEDAPVAPIGVAPPESLVPENGTQRIGGVVWFDTDRDGAFDTDELPAPGVPFTVDTVVDVLSGGFSFGTSLTIRTTVSATNTDGDGSFLDTVDAATYEVNVVPPAGYEVTYDSEGAADGTAQTDVPTDSFGYVWVGLALSEPGDGDSGGGATDLASTGAANAEALVAVAASLIGFGLIAMLPRRQRSRGAR
jgi:hypothetical protein